jgi:hypothetical protein
VTCVSCGSVNIEEFESEITVHFPQLKKINEPPVLVFAKLSVCQSCGRADFVIPQPHLARLSSDSTRSNTPVKKSK